MFQSFGVAWVVGSLPLFWALFISFILGTAYSVNVSLISFTNLLLSGHNLNDSLRIWCLCGCLVHFLHGYHLTEICGSVCFWWVWEKVNAILKYEQILFLWPNKYSIAATKIQDTLSLVLHVCLRKCESTLVRSQPQLLHPKLLHNRKITTLGILDDLISYWQANLSNFRSVLGPQLLDLIT